MLLKTRYPIELSSTLEGGQAFRWRKQGDWHYGVVFEHLIKVRSLPDGIEFFASPSDEEYLAPLLSDYLRLDEDIEAIYKSIAVDDRVRNAIKRYRWLRVLRQEPWECLISYISSAICNISRISRNMEELAITFGQPLVLDGQIRCTFPSPDMLAGVGEAKLRELGLGFRAKYIDSAAKAIADNRLDLFSLRETSYEDAYYALTALPGVGSKVANCVLLFSLDKPDAFPVDVWINRAITDWYPSSRKKLKNPQAAQAWAAHYFGRHAGYANQYLFHTRRMQDKVIC